ncbi:DUF6262 family protein [Kitasatospora sp. LaBMicrA B282]|uniref:DUF6262 family protein n=1 Tax=Kitasatospora sp. LaBMicrA B282 TaxID=3420949 RepID=UPI003D09E21B
MNRSTEALADAARRRTENAEKAVQKALRQARKDGGSITVKGLAAAAGVSTDFIYRHPDLRGQVEALRRARRSGAPASSSSVPDVDAASSTLVRRLSQELADVRRKHREEVAELRQALEVAHGELLGLRRQLREAADKSA